MFLKSTLFAILLTLIPLPAQAHHNHVTVVDETDGSWPVAIEVNAFRDAGAPLRMGSPEGLGCQAPRGRHRETIVVICEDDLPHQVYGLTTYGRGWIVIRVDPSTPDRPNTLCHEMMHALTRVGDNANALPDTSCVWGWIDTPGPFDRSLLWQTFHHH